MRRGRLRRRRGGQRVGHLAAVGRLLTLADAVLPAGALLSAAVHRAGLLLRIPLLGHGPLLLAALRRLTGALVECAGPGRAELRRVL